MERFWAVENHDGKMIGYVHRIRDGRFRPTRRLRHPEIPSMNRHVVYPRCYNNLEEAMRALRLQT
jgi:hypothetical protein